MNENALVSERWQRALMGCAAMVLASVLVKCVVGIAPQLYWDVDPRSQRWLGTVTMFGPGALAWLNSASLLVAAASVGVHILAGGRVAWRSTLLVLVGATVCAVHMPRHADNLRLCGSWIAASALGLAALHLATHDGPRRLFVAALVALVVPWSFEAAWFTWVEHPLTLADYEADLAAILKSRRIAYGSARHLMFEKRMLAADAAGPFAMSNVFGSVSAALTVLAAAVGVGQLAERRRIATAPLLVVAAGIATVAMTRSKGAAVSVVAVAATLGAAWLLRRFVFARLSFAGAALGAVVVVVAVVIARGAAGPPPTAEGEISLLFRSQYWRAAGRMLLHGEPRDILTGVGPASFRRDYPQWKDELNPEQVNSSHNVLIDQVTMLGLGGAAWGLLLLGWLLAAGQRASPVVIEGSGSAVGRERDGADRAMTKAALGPNHGVEASDIGWTLCVAVPVFATQYGFQQAQFDPPALLRWLAGAGGFVFVTAALRARTAGTLGAAPLGLFAAALLLILHSQIEITFFMEGASALAWLVVAAAAARHEPAGERRWWDLLLPAVLLAGSVAMATVVAVPVARQQSHLATAAASQHDGNRQAAEWGLEEAIDALPIDPTPYRSLARLLLVDRRARDAQTVLQRARDAGLDEAWRLRLLLEIARAQVADERGDGPPWTDAVSTELLRRHPFSVHDHMRVANLMWQIGKRTRAVELYRRVLTLSDQAYLDPSRQLTEAMRRHVMSRLERFH